MKDFSQFINSSIPIIPIFMIIIGLLWVIFPNKNRNVAIGYRTTMSMRSDETWEFAHIYISRMFLWSGLALLVLHIEFNAMSINPYKGTSRWIIFIEVAVALMTLILTEIALFRKYDSNGKLKQDKK